MTGDGQPTIGDGGIGVYARIEAALVQQTARLDRIEDKLDARMTTLDSKVDTIGSRQDRLEGKLDGTLGMIRWLGPTGVAAIIFGAAKAAGIL